MEKIDKILLTALYKKPIGRLARSAMVCFYAEEWGEHRFKAISFSNGVLKLSVGSSAGAMELDMKKEELFTFLKSKSIQVKKIYTVTDYR